MILAIVTCNLPLAQKTAMKMISFQDHINEVVAKFPATAKTTFLQSSSAIGDGGSYTTLTCVIESDVASNYVVKPQFIQV